MFFLKHAGAASSDVQIQRILFRSMHRSHYDALGLTPKASQSDIKKAYYKLSMQFHPDKNKGDDNKFREITAAYEILGNLKLRRLYDRGMLTKDSLIDPDAEDLKPEAHPQQKFYDSRSSRSRVPTTGRTTVYNFDEWSRAHYSETFSKGESQKRVVERKQYIDSQFKSQRSIEGGIFGLLFLLIGMGFIVTAGRSINPDSPSKPKKTDGS